MTEDTVEVLETTDRQRGAAALTLAFSSDPVVRWAWPDPERYLTYWPQFVDAFGGGRSSGAPRTAWRSVWR